MCYLSLHDLLHIGRMPQRNTALGLGMFQLKVGSGDG